MCTDSASQLRSQGLGHGWIGNMASAPERMAFAWPAPGQPMVAAGRASAPERMALALPASGEQEAGLQSRATGSAEQLDRMHGVMGEAVGPHAAILDVSSGSDSQSLAEAMGLQTECTSPSELQTHGPSEAAPQGHPNSCLDD